jgi:xanthine dehydrogenase YagR molybdenum-binding subunit
MANTWPKERRLLGTSQTRLDGPDKATGKARYGFDINRPGMLHARIVRSPHPHVKIKAIDTAAAEKVPGFKALHVVAEPGKELYYAGDEIIAVACDTEEHAADAARAIKIEYDILDAQVREEDALKKDLETAPPVGPQKVRKNVRPSGEDKSDDIDDAFKKAAVVHEGDYGAATICHHCLEPHGLVAEWGKDEKGQPTLTVWASTQAVTAVAGALAGRFGIPSPQVKCITHYMGGGYGSKFSPGVEGEVAAELAKKAGAPVKLFLDRSEEATTAGNRPSVYGKVKIGATQDGKIVAYACDSYGTSGIGGGATVTFNQLPYVYPSPSKHIKHTVVRLNAGMARAMRAPNHPQNCLLTDCPLDDLAAKLGMDPMQVRLKNLPPNDADAAKTQPQSFKAMATTIYTDEIKIAARLADWDKRWHPPGKGEGKGPIKHGIGMALHTWGGAAGGPNNDVNVTVSSDGSVLIESSTQDLGTGERTVLAIIAAEVLGLEPKDITIRIGESQYGRSSGSGGSTTCPGTSPVVYDAALTARDDLLGKIADKLKAKKEDLAIEAGQIVDKGNNKKYPWKMACAKLGTDTAVGKGTLKPALIRELTNFNVGGVQIAEVSVDTETGVVRCTKVVAVQDCGLVVNKLGCESQVAGGVIMGVNYALFEERIMDRQTGRQVNDDMEFYKLGGIRDMPQIVVHMHDMPERGVIGIGEPPTISTAAAIGNAIFNAIGARVAYAPYTPERVLEALSKKA